jgi:TPR repeat protein
VSSGAGKSEFLRWISRPRALGAQKARRRPNRERAWVCGAGLRLILLILVSTAAAPGARADAFAKGQQAYARQNYPLAAQILLPLAERWDPRAQTYIGVMYLRGKGVPQNFLVAAYWLHLAAGAGYPEAQYFLGMMYDEGQGVAQDVVLAHAWLNLAVAHAEPSVRGQWALMRDAVASKMSVAQLWEARKLAYEWRPDPPR